MEIEVMKTMLIYEPAMCCSTGLCGVSVDPELLRISTALNNLKKNGIMVARYNLTNAPQEFIKNNEVNELITKEGIEVLPVTVVDGKVEITGRNPTKDEFIKLLNVPESILTENSQPKKVKATPKKPGGCGCTGGKCH
jgi:hypothetical protein